MMNSTTNRLTIINNIYGRKITSVRPSSLGPSIGLQKALANKEIFCITKDSNPDGICGPTLLMHNYKIKAENILFTNYKDLEILFRHLTKAKITDSAVIFNDLGISPGTLECSKRIIRLLKSKNNLIIWIDHHPWDARVVKSIKNEPDFAIFGENPEYCAAELVYILLCNRDSVSRKIAMLAHYSDFVVRSKYDALLKRLSYSIIYLLYDKRRKGKMLGKVVEAVSKLDFNNKLITKTYKLYMKDEAKNTKELLKNSYTIKAGSYVAGLAFSKGLQTNAACAAMADALHSDINIYINVETGKGGIRSAKGVDGSLIAKSLRGGGHPQASGFHVSPSKFRNYKKSEIKNFVHKIERIAAELY